MWVKIGPKTIFLLYYEFLHKPNGGWFFVTEMQWTKKDARAFVLSKYSSSNLLLIVFFQNLAKQVQ